MKSHPNFVRIVTRADGSITCDSLPGLESAVAPINQEDWRDEFFPDNWTFKVISWKEYTDLVGSSPLNNIQIVADSSGKWTCDKDWEETLMPHRQVLTRYRNRLLASMKAELSKTAPDPIDVGKLTYELLTLSDKTLKETYELALDQLHKHADHPKPIIEQKLQAKIAELKAEESAEDESMPEEPFVCNVCGKVCASAGGLTLHKKTHE